MTTKQETLQTSPNKGQSEASPVQTQQAPSTNGQAQAGDENVRKLQATYDRRIYELSQQFDAAQRRIQELETRDLDEDGRTQYELKRLQEEVKRRDQIAAGYRAELEKNTLLNEIAIETGAPLDELNKAQNPDEAWKIGMRHLREMKATEAKKADEAARKEENFVDLGTSGAFTSHDEWEAAIKKAEETKNSRAYVRLLRMEPQEK